MPTPSDYSELVTSEYQTASNFISTVQLYASASCDLQAVLGALPEMFDLDSAMGSQLDELGVWVGFARYIFVPSLGTVTLNDADYQTLLRAKILANHWDGTNASLQVILASLFPGTSVKLFAIDNQDMTMDIVITNGTLTSTQLALVESGLLIPRPEGVLIAGYIQLTGPLFGTDFETSDIAGPDVGAFATFI